MHKGNPGQPKASALSIAVKSALCLSLTPGLVAAQDDVSEEVMETITVTGSRIPRLDPQMVTPVQVYDSDFIENTGAATMQDFLFTASFAGPGLFNENQTLSQTAGTANFDSRGFGDDYVVILLNGRRLPGDPVFGDGATNLNLIPLAAVDRVEYLSTGASAIYGADAVQGVLNIITKQEYEGLEVKLQYGNDQDSGGGRTGISVAGGVVSDKGFATISFEWLNQDDVDAAGLPLIGSAIAPDGTDGRSTIGAVPDNVTFLDFENGIPVPAPNCPPENLAPSQWFDNGQDCTYDFAPLYDAIPAQERMNFLASAEYNLGDRLTGYGEFRMSRNLTKVRNGAAPAIFNVTGAASLADIDAQLGTDLFNSSSVYILRRATDAGPRASDNTNTAYSVTLGARFELGGTHELDVSVQNIESEMNFVGVSGNLSRSRTEAAVASGLFDPLEVYDKQWFITNGIAVAIQRQGTGNDRRLNLTFTGEIGDSGIGYAVGGLYKEDDFVDTSDAVQIDRDVSGGAGSAGLGERENAAFFGELSYSPIDTVEMSLAARYDTYDWTGIDPALGVQAGSDASEATYMAGISFRPVDNLLLRASYGTGFKAPTLGELYLGGSFGVTRAVDTTFCNQVTADPTSTPEEIDSACRTREIRSQSGGNVFLETESSTNLSVGMVWEPTDNWSVALDYYDIEVEDKIGSLSVQEILNNESSYPELVNRVGGQLSHPDAFVASNLQNLNLENGSGIDFSTRADFDMNTGSIVTDLRVAYLLKHERQTSAVQPLCDDAGTTSEPEWRINGQIGWQAADWTTTMTFRYLGSTDDLVGGREDGECTIVTGGRVRSVDSYLEVGLRGTYDFNDQRTQIAAGIINLTDEEPPFSEVAGEGWPFFDQSLYDARGTRYYLNLTHNFF
ncbi:MAG: TonB-dependent receptor [Gammaproteobacteria bacterium]|nr:TonB-dependent receptor [Gammaproteobacteria bacterium]MDH3372930.1 TonB-dependent receptor [Gammaproteobacteria bacterium]MDH3409575.1 TonB-dependent receptor [Gammaproteobacteria bacterium]MDH3552012.1 TonB-dependent receptor [Gammaproteobacteria bacterium]